MKEKPTWNVGSDEFWKVVSFPLVSHDDDNGFMSLRRPRWWQRNVAAEDQVSGVKWPVFHSQTCDLDTALHLSVSQFPSL